MRCLVTGASGHLGSAVVRLLVQRGIEVAAMVRPQSDLRRLEGVLDHVTLLRADLTAMSEVAKAIQAVSPEVVVHLAWQGVTSDWRDDVGQMRINISGSLALLEMARWAGCRHWIGMGSQAEYGPYDIPLTENLPTKPQTAYGVCKLCTGLLTQKMCELSDVAFTWFRLIATYGPADDARHLIPSVIRQLLAAKRPALTPGEQECDYLYVEDAADAVYRAVHNGTGLGVVVLGSGQCHTIRKIVACIRDQIDPALTLGFGEVGYGRDQVMHLQADISKLRALVGWEPRISLEEGVRRTIEWHKSQMPQMDGRERRRQYSPGLHSMARGEPAQ